MRNSNAISRDDGYLICLEELLDERPCEVSLLLGLGQIGGVESPLRADLL